MASSNNSATAEKLLTAEEFFALATHQHGELVNGRVVELIPPGGEHGEFAGDFYSFIKSFVRQHKLGRCFVETGFVLQREPDIVRSPDVSFVEISRLPEGKAPRGYIEGAPTLAVEIVSPGDLWSEVEDKIQEYFDAGTRAVWIVEPKTQTVHVRTPDDKNTICTRFDTLPDGDVLPGFELSLAELFE